MITADMHSHTDFSGDCKIPKEEMVKRAIELGLKYYAITDHHDLEFPECGVSFELDLDEYMPELENYFRTNTTDTQLLKGIEFGLQPHLSETLSQIATQYDFDFIIGSGHLANGKDPYQKDFYEGMTQEEGYRLYFDALLKNVSTIDAFDSLGHLDYNIRYWRGDSERQYTYETYDDVLDAILKTLIRKDKALEVNTSGYLQKLEQPNPAYCVLSRYYELGGELLTIGSDAHLPQNIKSNFDITEERLKQIGFKSYTIYEKRRPKQIGF